MEDWESLIQPRVGGEPSLFSITLYFLPHLVEMFEFFALAAALAVVLGCNAADTEVVLSAVCTKLSRRQEE